MTHLPIIESYRNLRLSYGVDDALLGPFASLFTRLHADRNTKAWIDSAFESPVSGMQVMARNIALKVMSDYDANGLVGSHDMRVLGTEQWQTLLGHTKSQRLLDVGAGDGLVTDLMKPLFHEIETTELSRNMAKRLRERGYPCHEIDLTEEPLSDSKRYNSISLLNVIDRTSRPLTLLTQCKAMLENDGRLIVAVPLPLSPHVHVGPLTVAPEEDLPKGNIVDGKRRWETSAVALAQHAFQPLGLIVERFSRAPYFCRGTKAQPVHTLDDAIFVLRQA